MSHISIVSVIFWFSWTQKSFREVESFREVVVEQKYFRADVSAHYYTTYPIWKYIQLGFLAGNFYMFSKLLIACYSNKRVKNFDDKLFLNILVDSN